MAQQVKNLYIYSVPGDTGLIPDLTQWARDPAFPQAAAWVTDVAQIWCCHGCGIGWQLQLQIQPLAWGISIYRFGYILKKKKSMFLLNAFIFLAISSIFLFIHIACNILLDTTCCKFYIFGC